MGVLDVGGVRAWMSINGIERTHAGLTETQRDLDLTASTARRAGVSLRETEGALAGTGRAASTAASASARFRAAQLQQIAAQARLTELIDSGSASTARLAAAEASVVRANERVRASSPAAAMLAQGRASEAAAVGAERNSRSLIGLSGGALKTAAGLGLVVGGFALVTKALDIGKEANAYQADMVRIRALTGASTGEIKSMSGALLGLSGKVAQAPEDLATSLYHLESIGVTGKKALEGVTAAAKGADIGNANLEETTNALTSTIASGITKGQGFNKTMSQLLTIVGTGDMKLSDFNDTLSTGLLSIMARSGVSLRDTGAALATFGDNNIRGANAATMLRVAVQALQSPVKGGAQALSQIGLNATDLRDALQKGGLNAAVTMLKDHLESAGYAGKKSGSLLVDAFGKKANTGISVLIGQYDRLQSKYGELDHGALTFGQRWTAVTQTASFRIAQLGSKFEAAGITLAGKLSPAAADAAKWLGTAIPHALGVLQSDLIGTERVVGGAFVAAWHAALAILQPLVGVLGDIGHFLSQHQGLATGVATGVLAMWAAWKAYNIATVAVAAIRGAMLAFRADMGATASAVRTMWTGAGTESAMTAALMEQEFAAIALAAQESAAEQSAAFAREAEAYAVLVAASDDATAQQVANAQAVAMAAQTSAAEQAAAAKLAADAATVAAEEVDAAGMAAGVGWSAALGPLAAVGIGVGLLTGLFSGNSDAAEQNKSIMDAYAQSLQKSANALADVNLQATAKNLQESGAIDLAHQLTAANAGVGVGYGRLTLAINGTDQQYQSLHDSLMRVAAANKTALGASPARGPVPEYNATGEAAVRLSDKITQLRGDFTKQMKVQQELASVQHDAQVAADHGATAVAHQSQALHLTSSAYINAQLAAKQNTDQTKAQTAAFQAEGDAASLLQQALDGLAGVNLGLAQARTAVRSADQQVIDSFKKSKDVIDGNTKAAVAHQQAIQGEVSAAQALAKSIGDADRKRGEAAQGEQDEIASLRASKQAIEDRLSAQGKLTPAIRTYIEHLYNLKAVSGYLRQHPTVVNADTSGADKKVADTQAKITAIRQSVPTVIAANPDLANMVAADVQRRINALVGKELTISAKDNASTTINKIKTLESLLRDKSITITTYEKIVGITGPGGSANKAHDSRIPQAAGTRSAFGQATIPPNTEFTVGEGGTDSSWEGGVTDSMGRASIFSNTDSKRMGFQSPVGYASGTLTKAQQAKLSKAYTKASDAITGIGLDKTGFHWERFAQQIATAAQAVAAAVTAGASPAQITALRDRLTRDERRGDAIERKLLGQIGGSDRRDVLKSLTHPADLIKALTGTNAQSQRALSHLTSMSDERRSLHQLEADARDAGVSRKFIDSLHHENARLIREVGIRDHTARMLATANSRLIADQKRLATEAKAIQGAVTGSFDITTAGTGFDGQQPITGDRIAAQEHQSLIIDREFFQGIHKLGAEHLNKTFLRQLAEKGPADIDEVRALLAMKPSEITGKGGINDQQAEIAAYGRRLGHYVGERLYGGRIENDRRHVHHLREEERRQDRRAERDGRIIGREIEKHLRKVKIVVGVSDKTIHQSADRGGRRQGRRK